MATKEDHSALQEKHRKSASVRKRFEADWALNLSYLAGEQHVTWVPSGTVQPLAIEDGQVRITRNIMLKHMRIERAKILKTSPVPVALPITDGQRDIITARIATAYFRQLGEEWRFERRLRSGVSWALATGNGFFKWWWDGSRKTPKCTVTPPFEMYFDPYASTILDARWCIHSQFLNPTVALELYGNKNKDKLQTSRQDSNYPVEARLFGTYDGRDQTALEGCIVHEYWEPPSTSNAKGRFAVFTDDGILVDMDFPYEHKRLPFTQVGHIERTGSMWYRSGFDAQRPLQDEINRVEQQLVENRNLANGKWWIDNLLDMDNLPNALPRQVLRGSGPAGMKPEFIQINPLPPWVGQEPERLAGAMSDLAGQHEVSNAGVPGRVEAASAIQLLQEADDSVMQDIIKSMEEAIADGYMMALSYLKQYGDPVTDVRVYDKNGTLEKMELKKDNLSLDMRVVTRTTSGLPMTIAGRWDRVLNLKQYGVLEDNNKILEMLDLPSEEFDLRADQQDRSNAYRENRKMFELARQIPEGDVMALAKVLMQAEIQDNHVAHREEHWKFMKTPEYQELEDHQKEVFKYHCWTHDQLELDLLAREANKQAVLTGQAQAPNAAPSPTFTAEQYTQAQQESGAPPPVPVQPGQANPQGQDGSQPGPPPAQANGSPAPVA